MRLADCVLLGALTMILPGVCQAESPPQQQHASSSSLASFSRFFSQVAALPPPTETVYLNGQPTRLRYATLPETSGLSVRESESVKAVAIRCEEELRSHERSARGATLSARLASIDGQSDSTELSAFLLRRDQIITTAVNILKAELGSMRFDVLQHFVLEGSTRAGYFPLRAQ